jgi:hypothetical protein
MVPNTSSGRRISVKQCSNGKCGDNCNKIQLSKVTEDHKLLKSCWNEVEKEEDSWLRPSPVCRLVHSEEGTRF